MFYLKLILTLLGIVCLSCHFTIALDCDAGFYGNNCSLPCQLCETCDKSSGDCLTCPEGYYTSTCALRCRTPCSNCDMDGRCLKCEQPFKLNSDSNCICPNGTSNLNGFCHSCPDNCKDNLCKTDGSCDKCKSGFYGGKCTYKCFKGCKKCENSQRCIECEEDHTHVEGTDDEDDHCFTSQEVLAGEIILVFFIMFCIAVVVSVTYYFFANIRGNSRNRYNNHMYYPPPAMPVYMDGSMQMGGPGAPGQTAAMYYAVPSQHQMPGYMTPQMQIGPQDQTQVGQVIPQGQPSTSGIMHKTPGIMHPTASQAMFVPIPVPISRAPSAQPSQQSQIYHPIGAPSFGPPQYLQLESSKSTMTQGAKQQQENKDTAK